MRMSYTLSCPYAPHVIGIVPRCACHRHCCPARRYNVIVHNNKWEELATLGSRPEFTEFTECQECSDLLVKGIRQCARHFTLYMLIDRKYKGPFKCMFRYNYSMNLTILVSYTIYILLQLCVYIFFKYNLFHV